MKGGVAPFKLRVFDLGTDTTAEKVKEFFAVEPVVIDSRVNDKGKLDFFMELDSKEAALKVFEKVQSQPVCLFVESGKKKIFTLLRYLMRKMSIK